MSETNMDGTVVCWTQWLRENIAQLEEDPEHNVPRLLHDCIKKRDEHFEWTATHAFAASAESLGIEVMDSLFKFLEKMDQTIQLRTKDKDGDIPIQSAIHSKAPKEIIEFFIAKTEEEFMSKVLCSRNNKNQAPLLTAFDHSHWGAVEVLLSKCIECNQLPELTGVARDRTELKYNTILHRAFKRRNVQYFDIFLRVCEAKGIVDEELTAAVLIPNKKDETPWYYAIRFLTTETLEKVLKSVQDSTIDINSLYTDLRTKSTMLHEAYRVGNRERCRLLEGTYGALPQKDKNGLLPSDRDRQIREDKQTGSVEDAAQSVEGDSVSEFQRSVGEFQRSDSVSSTSSTSSSLDSYVCVQPFSESQPN